MHFSNNIETPMFDAAETAEWPTKKVEVDQSKNIERIRVCFNSKGSIMALRLLDRDE